MNRRLVNLVDARHRSLIMGILVIVALPTIGFGQPASVYVGTETCLACHDGMAADIGRTIHGKLREYQYPGASRGCESCHGPGSVHAESGDPADMPAIADDVDSEACLACHKTGATLDWEMSVHAASDVACVSCHRMHDNTRRALLADDEKEVCFTCHMDMKGKFQLPSHHPVREGFMTCSSCHDTHGRGYKDIAEGETSREACLACHNEYAGPFIFEHSPVEEDCNICHDVHGTVANNLLRQNEPFLCLQCHQPHFHSILAGDEVEGWTPVDAVVEADPNYDGLSLDSHRDSMKRVMMTKCTQCHQSVHGTDLPSQSIPGQGRALNR